MAIRFTMAKRGVLPEEKQVEEGVVRGLQPRLEHRQTVDVVRFQDERHWGSVLRGGDLAHAADVETLLGELFARKETITHKDVLYAFDLTLTKHRVTSLLQRLTAEGLLIREGEGSQTRYRAAAGPFGK